MAFTAEYFASLGRKGGAQRANALTPKQRERIARKAAKARWHGLNAAERKIERAKGRAPKPEKELASKMMAAKA